MRLFWFLMGVYAGALTSAVVSDLFSLGALALAALVAAFAVAITDAIRSELKQIGRELDEC